MATLAERYAAFAHEVIGRKSDAPFLLYVAFAHMHVPQFHSVKHANVTGRGHFADALYELDQTVGSIIASLATAGKTDSTLVLLTGDNGPSFPACL